MAKVTPYDAIDYKTSQGYVLKPGDSAVAVTKSAGSASLVAGRYIGLRRGNVVMEVDRIVTKLVHDETGEPYDWNAEYRELPYPVRDWYSRDPAVLEKYQDDVKYYGEAQKARRAGYSNKQFKEVGYTTLQLNKIFPGEIKAKDLSL